MNIPIRIYRGNGIVIATVVWDDKRGEAVRR